MFNFGQPQATASSIFGAKPAAATTSIFGTPATTAPSFGFGATAATAAPTGLTFGQTAPIAAPTTGFGGFGSVGAPTTGFGATQPATTGFGATQPATTGFGATNTFGATTAQPYPGSSTGLFGSTTQPQQPVQTQAANDLSTMAAAVSMPQIFNDERDHMVAKWNQLQAFWGTGKGFYSQNGAVDFRPDNPFCRFKAIGYSCLAKNRDDEGLVALTIDRKAEDVQNVQQQFIDTLNKILGSRPTLSVCVEGIKPLPDNKTDIIIYLLERPSIGPSRRIPANEVTNFFLQANIKTQLMSQLKVENVLPKTGLTKEQLKLYLDSPPAGIDPILWQQAKLDNPDPEKFIPVPMIGFKELHQRLKHQDQQTKLHQDRLDVMSQDLVNLQSTHTNMLAKLEEDKRRQLELCHRTLKVIVKQEVYRKMGYAIQADEEQVRIQLEAIQSELNHPTQFKGRLNELMSQIRMQNHLTAGRSDISYQMDPSLQQEIKMLLKQQQEGLQHLIHIIKEDTEDLTLIEQGLAEARR